MAHSREECPARRRRLDCRQPGTAPIVAHGLRHRDLSRQEWPRPQPQGSDEDSCSRETNCEIVFATGAGGPVQKTRDQLKLCRMTEAFTNTMQILQSAPVCFLCQSKMFVFLPAKDN